MRERSLKVFFLVSGLISIPAMVAVWRMDRLALHMAVNRVHAPFMDECFPFVTELANGWVPAVLALLLLWKSWRSFLMMGLSTGLSAIAVQSLKHLVFSDVERPSMFLDRMAGLHLVAGVEMHHYFSFPSGHSTAAFSMCAALAVIGGKPVPAALLAVLAAVLAFSRVYLSQHFTEDVLAGALLGTVVATGVYMLLYRTAWGSRPALDRAPFRNPFN
ncbi:MAG: phosphatase PAP2 family protein [Flavobacteriales bacterium]|jgi:membrane-associated phospholipid phosphatase|nr:phosphatase PAP2 family protein [Flavobacteriales bacterium]MCB0759746.1 phosphatase PAP2 family protein [Flavobacteriales bacterium]